MLYLANVMYLLENEPCLSTHPPPSLIEYHQSVNHIRTRQTHSKNYSHGFNQYVTYTSEKWALPSNKIVPRIS